MTPIYLSSHHVPLEADDPVDAARTHRVMQHLDEAPIYEVVDADTETLHVVHLDTEQVDEP